MTAQPTATEAKPVAIPAALTVKELGDLLAVSGVEVIKRLMTNGVMASINQTIDYDTAAIVAVDLGFEPEEAVAAVAGLVRLKARGRHVANSVEQLEAMQRYFRDPARWRVPTQSHASHERQITCSALGMIQVQSNGDLRVCTTLPPVGNIRRQPPSAIWRGRPRWWEKGCCLERRLSEAGSARCSPEPAPLSSPPAPPPA